MRQSWAGRPENENIFQMKADLEKRDGRGRRLTAQSEHDSSSFRCVFFSPANLYGFREATDIERVAERSKTWQCAVSHVSECFKFDSEQKVKFSATWTVVLRLQSQQRM